MGDEKKSESEYWFKWAATVFVLWIPIGLASCGDQAIISGNTGASLNILAWLGIGACVMVGVIHAIWE